MKPPMVSLIKPSARRTCEKFRSQLHSLESRMTALRITEEHRDLLPPGHYWTTLFEQRDLLRKQMAKLKQDFRVLTRVRATPRYLYIGSQRVDMDPRTQRHNSRGQRDTYRAPDCELQGRIWMAIHTQSFSDHAGCVRQAERVMRYWRKLHPVRKQVKVYAKIKFEAHQLNTRDCAVEVTP